MKVIIAAVLAIGLAIWAAPGLCAGVPVSVTVVNGSTKSVDVELNGPNGDQNQNIGAKSQTVLTTQATAWFFVPKVYNYTLRMTPQGQAPICGVDIKVKALWLFRPKLMNCNFEPISQDEVTDCSVTTMPENGQCKIMVYIQPQEP